jgi:hypothetical protein
MAKKANPAKDQQAADALPFPGDDQAEDHSQHRGEEQVYGEGLGKRLGIPPGSRGG